MKRALASLILLAAAPLLAEEAPPAAPAPPPPPPTATLPTALAPAAPLAGYSGGLFFLRDPNDWFIAYPKGRLQVDSYLFVNRGDAPADVVPNSAADPRLKDTIFVRRARVGVAGTFIKHFDFYIEGEWANAPGAGSTGSVADAYIVIDYLPWLKLQLGQFNAPFTLENRTSNNTLDFMERSVTVRSFGIPQNKEQGAMLFGWLPSNAVYYSAGVFNGDGQNFRNQDNSPLILARVLVAPLAPWARDRKWMNDVWVGGSFWWSRHTNLGGFVAPNASGGAQNDLAGMSTQGGAPLFSSSYGNGKDADGAAIRSHLAPNGDTIKWAIEASLPIKRAGLRFELVHSSQSLAEYNDIPGQLKRAAPVSGAHLDGTAFYVEAFGWILGDVNFISTPGGVGGFAKLKPFEPAKEPRFGLMLAAKYERIVFDVTGLPMGDAGQGHYALDVVELGVNAWATRHVRLTANYIANLFGSGDDASPVFKKNFFYGRAEHELLFRVAVNL
ncbi:MAG: hypothetical protein EXR72_17685 [Myxococcales bacterium]|nr:hypothetical protein [Myxococcales bacterium]